MFLHLRWLVLGLALALALAALPGASLRAEPVRVDTIEAELLADSAAVVPGATLRLGLLLRHDPEWHTYWRNPGDSGLPTQFEPIMPDGFEAGPIQWPWPERVLIPPLANFGYEHDVLLVREVRVPETVDGATVRFETLAQWLVCREVCVPGEARLSLALPVAGAAGPSAAAPLFDAAQRRLPSAEAVAVRFGERELSLHVPAGAAGPATNRLEYFPFREQLTVAAGDQRMTPVPGGGWRLDVPLAESDVQALQSGDAAGVVVIDESRAIEVRPQAADAGAAFLAAAGPGRVVQGRVAPFMLARQDPAAGLLAAAGAARGGGASVLAASDAAATDGRSAGAAPGPAAATRNPAGPGPIPDGTGFGPALLLNLLFAAIGGLILNLMPCVFPVIGLKILGFAGHGGMGSDGRLDPGQRSAVRSGSMWFAGGVVVSFWALAGLLLVLRGLGESIGWGFQLQSPGFVAAMALLFVAIGLNFSGLFEFGAQATRLGGAIPASAGANRGGAFASGVLAVLVATPCTAPFMGSAIGFTLAQPAVSTLAIFTALGLGMALPYILLGLFPGWLRLLPRPGRWMETFKQLLAFPMFAAAAWLAWVLERQAGGDAVFALLLGAVVLACGLWLWGRQVQGRTGSGRWVQGAIAAFMVLAGLGLAWPGADPGRDAVVADAGPAASRVAGDWQAWSQPLVASALAAGRPVFVDFTAAWCVSCQVNKKLVLESAAVREAFERQDVLRLRADWTQRDPAITAELSRHGRNSVPLYLFYPAGEGVPRILPELLTTGLVVGALEGR